MRELRDAATLMILLVLVISIRIDAGQQPLGPTAEASPVAADARPALDSGRDTTLALPASAADPGCPHAAAVQPAHLGQPTSAAHPGARNLSIPRTGPNSPDPARHECCEGENREDPASVC